MTTLKLPAKKTTPTHQGASSDKTRSLTSGARARVQAQVRAASGIKPEPRESYAPKTHSGGYSVGSASQNTAYSNQNSNPKTSYPLNRKPDEQGGRGAGRSAQSRDSRPPRDLRSSYENRDGQGEYREGSNYGQRTSFTPRNTPKQGPIDSNAPQEDKGFYGTGMSYRESATRRVEQKQAKMARQTGDTPARNYTRDLEFAARQTQHTPSANAQARVAGALKPWQGGERDENYRDPRSQNAPYVAREGKTYSGNYTPPVRQAKSVVQEDVSAAQPFFASCPRGLEWALLQELEGLGITVVNRVASGAMLSATWGQIAQANLHSRIASRFLWQLSAQNVRGEDDIYAQIARIPWENFFNWRDTLKVDTVGIRAEVRSLEFVTLRVKDAICDRFRSIDGNRPSIDTATPDMRVMCVLDGLFSQIYLDTTGEPLFKRGWRDGGDTKGAAALKENLAAGLLALTEWQGDVPLYDPMCGSGTLMIEAAQMAYGMPSGAARVDGKHFAMQRFAHLALTHEAYATPSFTPEYPPQLFASDINPEMVSIAAGNIQAAGLSGDAVHLGCMDVLEITPPTEQPGILVLNPPYGERMGFGSNTGEEIEADAFYDAFAANLKRNFKGWSVWLLTSDEQVQARMRLKPNATHHVFNGAIPCRWLKFEIT
jgi:putative N6-adenine-specific DNA methylase